MHRRGVLCLMRMFGTRIYVQVTEHLATQDGFGQHSLYSMFYNEMGLAFEHLRRSGKTLATGITGMVYVNLFVEFLTRKTHFVGIDNYHIVATIHVGGKIGLVLAAQQSSDFRSKTTHILIFGIHQNPSLLGCRLIGGNGSVSQGIHFQTIFIVKPITHLAQRERKDTRSFIYEQLLLKNFIQAAYSLFASKHGHCLINSSEVFSP